MKKRLLIALLCICTASSFAGNENDNEEKPKSTFLSVLMDKVSLTGYGQVGYTYNSFTPATGKESNTFDIKRIIFIANAEVFRNMNMYIMYDFATATLHEYWGEYTFHKAFKVKLGQFKVPFTIESLLSPAKLEIIEGAQGVLYLAGIAPGYDDCYGAKAGRDLGLMAEGDFLPYHSWDFFSYKLGVFNGQGINKRDLNNHKDVVGSLMMNPLKGVSLGGSFYLGQGHAEKDNPFGAFKAEENYKRNRWSVGTEIETKPVYVRAEYYQGKDETIDSYGAYAVASFHVHRQWDIIASWDYFNRNKDAKAGEFADPVKQTNYIAGIQWNFYRRCRLQAQYVFQDRGKGNHNANLIMTQFQLGF